MMFYFRGLYYILFNLLISLNRHCFSRSQSPCLGTKRHLRSQRLFFRIPQANRLWLHMYHFYEAVKSFIASTLPEHSKAKINIFYFPIFISNLYGSEIDNIWTLSPNNFLTFYFFCWHLNRKKEIAIIKFFKRGHKWDFWTNVIILKMPMK